LLGTADRFYITYANKDYWIRNNRRLDSTSALERKKGGGRERERGREGERERGVLLSVWQFLGERRDVKKSNRSNIISGSDGKIIAASTVGLTVGD